MSQSIYERILDLRNRISLDGDDTIYEEDYLLLDEVLDYIENNEQKDQEETYNDTVDVYRELEIGARIKKQKKLLELYEKLADHRLRVIHKLLDEVACLADSDTAKEEDIDYILGEARNYAYEDTNIVEEIKKIKEVEKWK